MNRKKKNMLGEIMSDRGQRFIMPTTAAIARRLKVILKETRTSEELRSCEPEGTSLASFVLIKISIMLYRAVTLQWHRTQKFTRQNLY